MKARIYRLDDVDRTEEVAKEFTNLRQDTINEIDALQTQINEIREMVTKKSKKDSKGSVTVKSLILAILFAIVFCTVSQAAIAWRYEYGTNPYLLDAFMRNPQFNNLVIANLTMDTITLENGATIDNAANNVIEFNENSDELKMTFGSNTVALSSTDVTTFSFGTIVVDLDKIKVASTTFTLPSADGTTGQVLSTNGSGTLSWAANGGGVTDLDTAYNGGSSIDVDTAAVTLTVSDSDDNACLALINNDGTQDPNALYIEMGTGNTGIAILINSQANGTDISADNWSVTQAGAITAASADLTGSTGLVLANDATITNNVDGYYRFDEGGEDVSARFNSNTLTFSSSSGMNALNFGNFLTISGATTYTYATTGAGQDTTLSLTGATDSSLIISSTGTNTDALQITTTAGGIDITNGGAAGGEDIDIDAVLASLNLNADEDVATAITITASAGGIDITADGAAASDLDLVCTNGSTNISGGEADAAAVTISAGAGGITIGSASTYDIDVTATGGKILLTGNENAAGAVTIDTAGAGGTSETILLSNDQGTSVTEGAAAIGLVAAAGGVELRSTANLANAIALTADGGTTSSMLIFNDQGNSVTEGSASIEILSDAGGIELRSTANLANAISLTNDGGTTGTIQIYNDQGNSTAEGASSIELLSDVGSIELKSGLNAGDAINIMADSDTAAGITIFNDTGTGADSIYLLTDVGGITATASAGPIALTATGGTGDMTLTAGNDFTIDATGTISISDSNITDVGDLYVDDIVDDANSLIVYGVKCKIVTIDLDDDASTDDFQFDDDVGDQAEQSVRVMTIPAYGVILAANVRCFETVTGSASMGIELGTSSGGDEILATSDVDSANDVSGTAAGESPEIAAGSAAINVYISGTPGSNWNALDAGRWFVTVTYIDNGAMYTQRNP